MRKLLEKIVLFIGVLLIAWVALSFVEVLLHNGEAEPIYQVWNAFVLLAKTW